MIRIIIITHGNFGRELIASAEMIVGKQSDVEAISIGSSDHLNDLEHQLRKMMDNCGNENFLILTDMVGGSTCQVCLPFYRNPNIAVVSGVNLYMLLSALNNRQRLNLAELSQKIISDARRSIEDIKNKFCNYMNRGQG